MGEKVGAVSKDEKFSEVMPFEDEDGRRGWVRSVWEGKGSGMVFGVMCVGLFLINFLTGGVWAGFHGVLIGLAGVMVFLRPGRVGLPWGWWVCAGLYLVLACGVFLPAGWFDQPAWRGELEALGVKTGEYVVIQWRQAGEMLVMFAVTLLVGMWMAGHRATGDQLRVLALLFTVGVAVYAVVSRVAQGAPLFADASPRDGVYGFFPNRNHTATYLAMGVVCGLGCTLQALRDKRFFGGGVALFATLVCLWAVGAWSISRAGVVLTGVGGLLWMSVLGFRYLGRNGLWAVAILALTVVGLFVLASTGVKERIDGTLEKLRTVEEAGSGAPGEAVEVVQEDHFDFRLLVYADTMGLIRDFAMTGAGGGQFTHVFPMYRKETLVANGSICLHPESDWLWMATEAGVPAVLSLCVLVLLAGWYSLRGIRRGRDRALRAGCLVAALVVPIHGIFDVPGHRMNLAWAAALMFALSLPSMGEGVRRMALGRWAERGFGLVLIGISVFLIRAEWMGGPIPAVCSKERTMAQVRKLYAEDKAKREEVEARGEFYNPPAQEDPLEKALLILKDEMERLPMDPYLRAWTGFLAVHFLEKTDVIEQNFAVGRALTPGIVGTPFKQAEYWVGRDNEKSRELLNEALRMAKELDKKSPRNTWGSEGLRYKTGQVVRRVPDMKPYLPEEWK